MARLSATYDLKKDGSKNIKGYRIALPKLATEKSGFNLSSEVDIEFFEGKIILKKIEEK